MGRGPGTASSVESLKESLRADITRLSSGEFDALHDWLPKVTEIAFEIARETVLEVIAGARLDRVCTPVVAESVEDEERSAARTNTSAEHGENVAAEEPDDLPGGGLGARAEGTPELKAPSDRSDPAPPEAAAAPEAAEAAAAASRRGMSSDLHQDSIIIPTIEELILDQEAAGEAARHWQSSSARMLASLARPADESECDVLSTSTPLEPTTDADAGAEAGANEAPRAEAAEADPAACLAVQPGKAGAGERSSTGSAPEPAAVVQARAALEQLHEALAAVEQQETSAHVAKDASGEAAADAPPDPRAAPADDRPSEAFGRTSQASAADPAVSEPAETRDADEPSLSDGREMSWPSLSDEKRRLAATEKRSTKSSPADGWQHWNPEVRSAGDGAPDWDLRPAPWWQGRDANGTGSWSSWDAPGRDGGTQARDADATGSWSYWEAPGRDANATGSWSPWGDMEGDGGKQARDANAISSWSSWNAMGRNGTKRDGPLETLCGEWRDMKGSTYRLQSDGANSLSVLTIRPDGEKKATPRLVRQLDAGGLVTWGASATFELIEPVPEGANEVRWRRREGGQVAFTWRRQPPLQR